MMTAQSDLQFFEYIQDVPPVLDQAKIDYLPKLNNGLLQIIKLNSLQSHHYRSHYYM